MAPRHILFALVISVLALSLPSRAVAGPPTERIRLITDRIIEIVSGPALKGPENKDKRRRLIREAVDEVFDWREMARRTLARHWKARTEEEKEEFVRLLGKLLERTYMDRVDDYSGEKVAFLGETLEDEYGVVTVEIITRKNTAVSVLYRMKLKKGKWYVYDISIEGVSLVHNYRTQFNSIIVRSSFKDLMEKLRDKVAPE